MPAKRLVVSKGDRFYKLVVVDETKPYINPASGQKCRKFIFKCDCGVITEAVLSEVTRGRKKSCGCLVKETTTARSTKHGQTKYGNIPPEYRSWHGMKTRCINPNNKDWANYGGRGITICEKWINSYENFFNDMGEKPSPFHSIDRIDNNKGYSPDNCRWATNIEQANNMRRNVKVTIDGVTFNKYQWCNKIGINYSAFKHRIKKGWSIEDAIKTPIKQRKSKA